MKKSCIFLTTAMLICLLAACGDSEPSGTANSSESSESVQTANAADSSETAKTSQSAAESSQSGVLYAVFSGDNVKEYPVEFTGNQKTAEGLSDELSKLTGLDFNITADKTDDGWVVDWAADSTLIAGLDDREQKEEFFFFDHDTLSWFMMDSLWRTLTENLGAENIYYTMDGGKELFLQEVFPVHEFPSDIPYMGSDFYFAHSDVKGDEENLYARTEGLWRMDGATDTASIEMNGLGDFTMYYADGSVEAFGHLECVDEFEDGSYRYDCYDMEGELIISFYFDSDNRFHIGNDDGSVYILDTKAAAQVHPQADYQGFWQYPDGTILEINGEIWNTYESDGTLLGSPGLVGYEDDGVVLRNEYGSSGGGFAYFDENGCLNEYGNVLTYLGESLPDSIFDSGKQADYQGFWIYPDGEILEIDGDEWMLYESGESAPFVWGPVEYDEDAAYLMNEDGSSGGGKVYFDENNSLVDSETVLTYWGDALSYDDSDDAPKG